ncbi:MAG: class I SAM-dependent methyltransferase [Catonella sp.]|uniref:class I SAM-dependent methyltransferase n=1 Tax=Catonella sp. TaxID=2382125 RepID=UPI003FA11461
MKNRAITLKETVEELMRLSPIKIIISNNVSKSLVVKRIQIEKKERYYQAASYTATQVFHKNLDEEGVKRLCLDELGENFLQLNAWTLSEEVSIKLTKKRKVFFDIKRADNKALAEEVRSNNRKKNYILEEGRAIEPLVDMGIFTAEGKVVNAMYDKYKQINRFIEIIDDELKKKIITHLNIIDFGCGKSYLTFIVYYYLTQIKKIKVNMIGLDLKEEVIKKCNEAAEKYGYDTLSFELGDINGYYAPFKVDMVITLHACDRATDFAIHNAINWGATYIFSVPCCQHELNNQIRSDEFSLMTKYGIIKERFSALITDAVRGNMLEYMGYNVNLLEFVDLSHTPKNILIRAVKNPNKQKFVKERAVEEVKRMMGEYGLSPTLYRLIVEKH